MRWQRACFAVIETFRRIGLKLGPAEWSRRKRVLKFKGHELCRLNFAVLVLLLFRCCILHSAAFSRQFASRRIAILGCRRFFFTARVFLVPAISLFYGSEWLPLSNKDICRHYVSAQMPVSRFINPKSSRVAAKCSLLKRCKQVSKHFWSTVIITSAKEVMFSSLFVCLLATFRKNFRTDLHEIFKEDWQWAVEQMVNESVSQHW